ncbi:hypothetical protein TNCV_1666291 [Trichonephila clavipes]|nr:hypothetical protein TNCV_1666291 [Trichonephila clavipes]
MVQEDTEARSKDAACVWTVAHKGIGSTRTSHMMRRSSQCLVCPGRPKHGFRVNEVSFVSMISTLPLNSYSPS